jgi:dolichyl-phosphate beta-glucosyltransferase
MTNSQSSRASSFPQVTAADLARSVSSDLSRTRPPALSIIIPAYNEAKRLGATLVTIQSHFAVPRGGIGLDDIEIIVVDDGSTDGTPEVVRNYSAAIPSLRLVANGANRGKGYSVRHGMREARGRIALFADADLSSSIEDTEKLLAAIAAGNDVAIGSRGIDVSLMKEPRPVMRKIAGLAFNTLVRVVVGLPFHDTQCGFKAFVRDRCRILFEQQQIEGFGFDPELLFLARRHNLKTVEVPVRSSHDPASKVRLIRDSLRMASDLVRIRWNGLLDCYPRRNTRQGQRVSAVI